MRNRLFSLLIFAVISSGLVCGQAAPASTQPEPTIQSLLQRIQQLENRIDQLEERDRQRSKPQPLTAEATPPQPMPTEAPPKLKPPAQPSPSPMRAEHPEHGTFAQEVERHYPSLQIRGFGDVNFSSTDQKGSISGFNLGQFDLHFASPLSEKVSYFGEVTFTARPTGYDLQLERTIIRYDYNDYFKMSFGKYHTPIGYWNAAFHHGAWLQTTISRPEMVQIGGSFIPVHFVGLLAEGNVPSGGLGLGYSVGLGNGRSSVFSRAGDSGDANNNRAWVATVFSRPARFYGFQFGGSVYRDKLTPVPGQNFSEAIESAHLVWTKEHPEVLSEFFNVHHRDLQTSRTFNSQAFYVQLGYRLRFQENKWKPYYRFEYIHRPTNEPVWDFTGVPVVSDLVGSTVGLRYDITNYAALKGEYRNDRVGTDEPRINGVFLQTAFTF
ncbi:MAG: hypothetical protein DMG89_11065 [Acidobacteria bacterium]|nr:MAG: hypothetical protein DMG89_11065 [Acidobacteriota bacterium]